MNRIEIACYSLIASAFFLASLLVFSLARHEPTAHADQLIARDNFTLMTAPTRGGVESLFVLDNATGRLLIYNVNARREIELAGGADMPQIFAQAATGGNTGRGRR